MSLREERGADELRTTIDALGSNVPKAIRDTLVNAERALRQLAAGVFDRRGEWP